MNNLVFDSKKSTLEFLASVGGLIKSNTGTYYLSAGTYYLAHGEYAQPIYKTRRYKDGWGIHVEYHYYAGTFYAPLSGRINPETFFHRFH